MKTPSTLQCLAVLLVLAALCSVAFAAGETPPTAEQAGLFSNAQRDDASSRPAPAATAPAPASPTAADVTAKADELTHQYRMQQEANKVWEVGILSGLAVVSLFLVLRYLSAQSKNAAPQIVNATGLICIIFGTILLSIMAHSDQQLTAAMGILGAVAGYLFRSLHGSAAQEPGAEAKPAGGTASHGASGHTAALS